MSGDVSYELTAHAARVLKEREIPVEWVARVLERPERTEDDKVDPALRHALARVPEYGGRVLRVVYNGTTTPWRIVTAYFDRKERSGS
jgi:hypothetical protein